MPKMTPEQEARYALNLGVARSGLPFAAQLAYDRLVGGEASTPNADRHLRIWADRPVTDPDEDRFGFVQYADAFALLINDRDTSTPLTVAISGPWGSGRRRLPSCLNPGCR